jgi:hypothetical protein
MEEGEEGAEIPPDFSLLKSCERVSDGLTVFPS